jgi:predicted outer membrane protein
MVAMLNQTPKGAAFDTAYVNGQVMSHTNTLAMVQKAEGAAKDPALKSFLAGARPDIQKHLDEAKSLQGKLAGGSR